MTFALPQPGRVLALDFGSKRTGVAVSDPSRTIVRPLEPISKANSSDGLASIAALVDMHGVVRVIVGLPVGPSGTDTVQTARSRSFAARLQHELGIEVELHDERFTSKLADRTRRETVSDASRDSLAACHILESWMENQPA